MVHRSGSSDDGKGHGPGPSLSDPTGDRSCLTYRSSRRFYYVILVSLIVSLSGPPWLRFHKSHPDPQTATSVPFLFGPTLLLIPCLSFTTLRTVRCSSVSSSSWTSGPRPHSLLHLLTPTSLSHSYLHLLTPALPIPVELFFSTTSSVHPSLSRTSFELGRHKLFETDPTQAKPSPRH